MDSILTELRKKNMEQTAAAAGEDSAKDTKQEAAPKLKGVYRCRACGYIFDEAQEGRPFSTLTECPLCHVSPGGFQQIR